MRTGVARLFDAMADSYDRLEPWYEHLYQVLHAILRAELSLPSRETMRRQVPAPPSHTPAFDDGRRPRALDAGCGTGFQTTLLEALGYETHGLDISPGLLGVARRRLERPTLALGSIESLPYRDGSFDAVTCCGSTLSFVQAPGQAVGEIGRVLGRGGALLLECEHKWNLDLAWAWLSSVTGDSLGYGVAPGQVWCQVARPLREGCHVEYPGYGRLRLFTIPELRAMLDDANLVPVRMWGLHTITNLIPSTTLHRQKLPRPLAVLYEGLRAADGALSRLRPAPWLANSVVVLARKPEND